MSETTIRDSDPGLAPKDVDPNYNLSEETLAIMEKAMVDAARSVADDSIVACWIDPRHEFSNFLRTKEAQKFPEVDGVEDYYESHQRYLALVDTRGEGAVVHAATIMEFDDSDRETGVDRTGYYTVDSLIALGNFTKKEFVDYYKAQGIDLSSCISVETNFKINDDVEPYAGLGTADLTYLTLFNMLIDREVSKDHTVLFASVNEQQAKSLMRNGIDFAELMGRSDFHTEEADLGKLSVPVAIDFQSGYSLLAPLNMRLPELEL